MNRHITSRRAVLGGAAGLAVAAVLGGCTTPGSTTPSGGATGPATPPPTYLPFAGVTPDLPGNATGVPAAFFTYPKEPVSYAKVPIGTGEAVSVLTPTNGIGTPKANSGWWQNLQRIVGLDLNLNLVAGADLPAKQQALLAGGDIPDIAIVNPTTVPLGALQKYFADLGPYLSGDAVKEYRALGAIPSLAWRTPTVNGILFGVPQPRIAASYTLGVRTDQVGTVSLRNGDDLRALLKDATNAKAGRWGYGQDPMWLLRLVLEMLGVPNGANAWSESGGRFTSMYEAPEMPEALDFVAQVWKSGWMHPDSPTPNATWFPGGTVATYVTDFTQFGSLVTANPGLAVGLVPAPKWDGGGLAVKQLNAGASGNYAAFRKADEKRIRQLLQLCDYLAAPVGTSEYLAANFGQDGVSYTMQSGDPVLTDAGKADRFNSQALGYVASGSLAVLYSPGHAEFTKHQHEFLTTVMANTHVNPSIGLYSATSAGSAGAAANKTITVVLNDILLGRTEVAAWQGAVAAWRSAAGDAVRKEYEDAFARAR